MRAEVKGTTLPVLEVTLDSGETIISTHGELSWMTPNMQMSQTTAGGGHRGIMSSLKRAVGGGGLFLTQYEATGGPGTVAFASKLPGRIFPVEVGPSEGYLVHRHGWVCGTPGITPTVGLQQSFRAGAFGRDGFILQRLEGEGTAYIELSGEIINYSLVAGQTLLVHPGHVGMFQDSVNFQITQVQGLANKFFGGDGYYLVALTGPGDIWLQSMPVSVLAQALEPYLGGTPAQGAAAGGIAGGVVGELFGRNL
ncbi:MAG: AIM24 family protein [Acidimicrobiales bacterium]